VDAEGLQRAILALPTLQLRVDRVRHWLSTSPASEAADTLNGLAEALESNTQRAHEALFPSCMVLAALGECDTTDALLADAQRGSLLCLERMLRRGPQAMPAERNADELPVPDYGTGRELTVGERRSMARRPSRGDIARLVLDPHPMVIAQLLTNPKLVEDDVIALVARRPARVEVLGEVVCNVRWLARTRIRMGLIQNPGTPPSMTTPLLPLCTGPELRDITRSPSISVRLRVAAREWLERRPPVGDKVATTSWLL
jgi:hypothetical protein